MKVAIVHDYIKEYGGAERVLEALHEVFPDATIFTLVYLPEFLGPHKKRFDKFRIKTSFLQSFPFKSKLISLFRLISKVAFKSFDFGSFDIVIVSATGAYSPNAINKKSALQICYCHTPPRYLYGFSTARQWSNNQLIKFVSRILNRFLRIADIDSAKNVDFFIANSQNVANRIRKFYKRDAEVIYPPVDDNIKPVKKKNNDKFFLAGGRLARPKNISLIIETFKKLGWPLKVFGKEFAGYGQELIDLAGDRKNIEFLGEIDDNYKISLMQQAQTFIFAAQDEDFGITPVEAMAAGTPVVAYRSGGVMESVVQNQTGVFFDTLSVQALEDALKKIINIDFDPQDIHKYAKRFVKSRFREKIHKFVRSLNK